MIRQCDSRNTPTVAEHLFLRQLRFVIVSSSVPLFMAFWIDS